jgi:nitrite reductase/ring-hydroxylating ferredoxin subunit
MPEVRLFPVSALAPNSIRRVELPGQPPIAIYNLDGSFYATADTCTHGEASLAEGDINGDEIVCPFHMGAFDIRSGQATLAPCVTALRTWPVRIDGDEVVIEIEA